MSNNTSEPRIINYGPHRLIGISRICTTSADCRNAWADQNGLIGRIKELNPHNTRIPYYGICRCTTGAEDGTFEYIAAMSAADSLPVPEGMTEITIPSGTYAEFPVTSLEKNIGQTWAYTGEWLAANLEWQSYCDGNPTGCGCINTPSFELYPPTFDGSGSLYIYIPIRPSA